MSRLTDNAIADGIRIYRIEQELNRRPNRTRRRLVTIDPGTLMLYQICASVGVASIVLLAFYGFLRLIGG